MSRDVTHDCRATAYTMQVSSVEWPSEPNTPTVIETFSDSTAQIQNSSDPSAALKKNMLKVEVYFQNFNFERITESAAYKVSSVSGDFKNFHFTQSSNVVINMSMHPVNTCT